MKRKSWMIILLLPVLLWLMVLPALAAIPSPTETFYVADYAEVLSSGTEQQILDLNDRLYQNTGAELVVVTVNFLDGEKIENYAYQLMNQWGIGQEGENRGLLLLLVPGEENYWAMPGAGLESILPASGWISFCGIIWKRILPQATMTEAYCPSVARWSLC